MDVVNIPFYQLINEDSEIWQIIQGFSTLYPQNVENLDSEIIENINEHFYYRQIAFSSPTKFLRAFHRLVKERAYVWHKMVASEKALDDEEMTRNYNVYEDHTRENKSNFTSDSESTPNTKTTTLPNLTTETTSETEDKSHLMDTPDGFTADIDNYLSQASKDNSQNKETINQRGNSVVTQTGNTKTNTKNTDESNENIKLHRYGNIGVQTASQILGGYREAQLFDAYESVIFPEVNQLFLNVIDLDEIELY